MDNFFSNVKLFIAFKDLSIDWAGKAKLRSGFSVEFLEICTLSTKKIYWMMKAYITSSKDILFLVWQDLYTTKMMTSLHSVDDIETSEFISSQKWHSISSNLVIETPNGNQTLLIPFSICKYNKHMGKSDANLQFRSYYLTYIQCFCYLFLLFQFSQDASFFNEYNLWKILQPNFTLNHIDFQHSIALKLNQNPLSIGRKYAPQFKFVGKDPMVDSPTYHFICFEKKSYCYMYRAKRNPRTWPRLAFASFDDNRSFRKKKTCKNYMGM